MFVSKVKCTFKPLISTIFLQRVFPSLRQCIYACSNSCHGNQRLICDRNQGFSSTTIASKQTTERGSIRTLFDESQLHEGSSSEKSTDELEFEEIRQQYLLPASGHRVFILHPDVKWGEKKLRNTTASLQLAEACALVKSLPNWHILHTAIYSTKVPNKKTLFGTGNFEEIGKQIHGTGGVTAVFINVDRLSALQLATVQEAWKLPVYDRYTVVLQIFQVRAKTSEAKLQVALAELPFLMSRSLSTHARVLNRQGSGIGLELKGTDGRTKFFDYRKKLLQNKESQIKAALQKVKAQRNIMKQGRALRGIPSVAIVGYTNAGKTSLIQCLSGDTSVTPRDQLFATLDVTVHEGRLPNNLKVLYVDTVGFISNLSTDLIASFSATLDDVHGADAIIHVQDLSHPDLVAQRDNVHLTLAALNLPPRLVKSIINVGNKAELLETQEATVMVGNLKYSTNEEGLRKYFERWGAVTSVRVIVDHSTGTSRGYGFVTYAFEEEMKKCLAAGPHELDGRRIYPRKNEQKVTSEVEVSSESEVGAGDVTSDVGAAKGTSEVGPGDVTSEVGTMTSAGAVDDVTRISCVTGAGMAQLKERVQRAVMENTGRVLTRLKVPNGSRMLSWLYKEAAVQSVVPCDDNEQMVLVTAIMTHVQLAKFGSEYARHRVVKPRAAS